MPAPVSTRTRLAPSSAEPHARCASRRSRAGGARGAPPASATGAGRSSIARERLDEQVVVLAVADRDPDRRRRTRARRAPAAAARRRARGRPRPGRRGSSPATAAARARARAAPTASRSRSSTTGVTSGGDASAASASAAESVDTGAGAWRAFSSRGELARGERVADARAGEPERLRERAQHDHVAVVDQRHRGLAEVLEVRLVDDERPRVRQRVAARRSGCSAGR